MPVLVKAVQTSTGCPSQWNAWDETGQYYYLRYRHSVGEVMKFRDENWTFDETQPYPGEVVARFEWGENDNDGFITLELFCEHAGFTIAEDCERTAFWRNISDQLGVAFQENPAALERADQLLEGIDLDKEE
jgi:hypothetical protein